MSATEANGWVIFGPPVRGRSCGACKLCCTLVPAELADGWKPHNVRCKHVRSRGCGIYASRPRPCQAWSCKWLIDASTAGLRRPDLAGYAIDPSLDTILAGEQPMEVIQVWCDPARPDAHRDPALRTWLAAMAERFGMVAIVRWGPDAGIILAPPAFSDTGDWLELGGEMKSEDQMRERLHEVGARSIQDILTGKGDAA
jgi:Pyruvate/2-oxoacid:ferredoxin oxidoreductase delta subunit